MVDIENEVYCTLKSHLFAEYYFRNEGMFLTEHLEKNKVQLFENYGMFDGFENIVYAIVQKLRQPRTGNTVDVDVNNSFIDKVRVEVIKSSTVPYSFMPRLSRLYKSKSGEVRFEVLYIRVLEDRIWRNKIYSSIAHELLHAYQDLNLYLKNTRLETQLIKKGYFKNNIGTYSNNKEKETISYLLYFFNNFENGAYVGEVRSELSFCKSSFDKISEVMDFLKGTVAYKNYVTMFDSTDKVLNEKNEAIQNSYLNYANELSDYSFTTFNELCRFLRGKREKCQTKFNTMIPKLAYQYLYINKILSPNVDELINI